LYHNVEVYFIYGVAIVFYHEIELKLFCELNIVGIAQFLFGF